MNEPKILLCIMSCNNELYKKEEEILYNTYLKFIEKYNNIDYIIFDGDENINETYKENNHLHIKVNDTIYYTYEKNIELFKYIKQNNIEYDYLVRTNCSTFINIHLLNDYLTFLFNNYKDDKRLIHIESHIVDNYYMITGKFIIFNKEHIDILLNNIIEHSDKYYDDMMFSIVLQNYYTNKYNIKTKGEYDLRFFNIIPSYYLNDIITRINYLDINKVNNYDHIKHAISINCKPYKQNDFPFIKASFEKLYNIINNEYQYDIETISKIYSFNNLMFSHNQNEQHMFCHPTIYNIILANNKLNPNDVVSYINTFNKCINHIYIYSNNLKEVDSEFITIKKLNNIDNIYSEFENIYNNEKYKNYRYYIVIDSFVDLNKISKIIHKTYNNGSNLYYKLLNVQGIFFEKSKILCVESNIHNLNINKLRIIKK